MPDFLFSAIATIISAITLGIVGYVANTVVSFMRVFKEQHEVLLESQRNQLKAHIVEIYERAMERGWITPMELETVNREFDSYKALGGNHYIHSLVYRMNHEMPVSGEAIPLDD